MLVLTSALRQLRSTLLPSPSLFLYLSRTPLSLLLVPSCSPLSVSKLGIIPTSMRLSSHRMNVTVLRWLHGSEGAGAYRQGYPISGQGLPCAVIWNNRLSQAIKALCFLSIQWEWSVAEILKQILFNSAKKKKEGRERRKKERILK